MSPPSIIFSDHALDRVAERGVEKSHVESVIIRPTLSGPADGGARWATGTVLVQGRRTFLSAIFTEFETYSLVVTAYLGPPSRVRSADGIRR